jgi:heme-degrading monooxygenase HmoA
MIAVLFEAFPKEGKQQKYFDLATQLKPELFKIDGFISIERFQSINDPKKLLSLSFWRDEESIKQWRNIELHRYAQKQGRSSIFENYEIKIADVTRSYSMQNREEAPIDSKFIHK